MQTFRVLQNFAKESQGGNCDKIKQEENAEWEPMKWVGEWLERMKDPIKTSSEINSDFEQHYSGSSGFS